MKTLINEHFIQKGVIICGPQGGGKSTLARIIAKSFGPYFETSEINVKTCFGFSGLKNRDRTVIIDGFTDWSLAEHLVDNEKIRIDRKGVDPIIIDSPNFIFITRSSDLKLLSEYNLKLFKIIQVGV